MSEGCNLEDSNPFPPVVRHQFKHVSAPYSQISLFIENQSGGVRMFVQDWDIHLLFKLLLKFQNVFKTYQEPKPPCL